MRKDEWPLSIGEDCLQVFDFGCGSLAMQFAVAWTASDAIEAGKPARYVEVDSYDASPIIMNLNQSQGGMCICLRRGIVLGIRQQCFGP